MELDRRLFEILKYVNAYNDIQMAHGQFIMLKGVNLEIEHGLDGDEQFKRMDIRDAFQTAAVVYYSRPFIGNRPFGAITSNFETLKKSGYKHIHEAILNVRSNAEAHSNLWMRTISIIEFNGENIKPDEPFESFAIRKSVMVMPGEDDEVINMCKELYEEILGKIVGLTYLEDGGRVTYADVMRRQKELLELQ